MSSQEETLKQDVQYLWVRCCRDYISNPDLQDLGVSLEEIGKGWYESTAEIAGLHDLEPEESRMEH